jgi:hypothetical protein
MLMLLTMMIMMMMMIVRVSGNWKLFQSLSNFFLLGYINLHFQLTRARADCCDLILSEAR